MKVKEDIMRLKKEDKIIGDMVELKCMKITLN